MKNIRPLIEPVIVSVIILIASVTNMWHVFYYALHRTPNTIFIGISHYYQDYFYYLSQVTQGARGAWMVKNLYTTENIPASPLWLTNILIGKCAALFHLYPWTAFDVSLFAVSMISLFLLYKTARLMFPNDPVLRVSAFFISVITTCYYLVQKKPDGTTFINPYQYFYNYTESLNRLGGVVHLILQNVLSLSGLLIFNSCLLIMKDPSKTTKHLTKAAVLFSLCMTGLLFINPIYVAVDALVFTMAGLIVLLPSISKNTMKKLLFLSLVTGIPMCIPAIATIQTFSVPFYQYFRWWETTINPTNYIIFLYSMGPIAILSVLGLVGYVKRGGILRLLGFLYTLTPILLYFSPIPDILAIPKFRLMQPPAYIFLGAAAVECFLYPDLIIGYFTKIKRTVIFFIILALYSAFQLPMIQKEMQARLQNVTLDSWVNHLDINLYNGLKTIADDKTQSVVLAFNNLEHLVPVLTGHPVYVGHSSLTYSYSTKIKETADFYSMHMTESEAKQFIESNKIKYILWRKKDGLSPLSYSFLTLRFENSALIVYAPVMQ
jgi:hypothetical protein